MHFENNAKIEEKLNNINIIDVTLRDGGHQVNFDWPNKYYSQHIIEVNKLKSINFIELGYWKQTAKSKNKFYNLNEQDLEGFGSLTNSCKKFSIMIDCHYCSHNISDYPSEENYGIGLVRVCSRSEDINSAVKLGENIKKRTGSLLSMNFFNITNYTDSELTKCVKLAANAGADFIYFADTHGTLDLLRDFEKYHNLSKIINDYKIVPGFHLHDHSGKAYLNYRILPYLNFGSTDVSLSGMGKGDGNLKLEHIIDPTENPNILNLLENNRKLLNMKPSSYGLISSHYSITDYYANEAKKKGLSPSKFLEIAAKIDGRFKDVYNDEVLTK